MTYRDLVDEARRLPMQERLAMIEVLTRSVREELAPPDQTSATPVATLAFPPQSALHRLFGIAKPDGPLPTDQELKEDYVNYLMEKYS